MSAAESRSYPRHVRTEAGDIEFRLMTAADETAVLDFARKLPVHDLLFLPRNISQPKVLSAWIREFERGAITSLLAIKDGRVVGCGTIVSDPHSWSPHVGGIRMVVSLDVRGQGVGRALSQERDIQSLLAIILRRACEVTNADARLVERVEIRHVDAVAGEHARADDRRRGDRHREACRLHVARFVLRHREAQRTARTNRPHPAGRPQPNRPQRPREVCRRLFPLP